ncbi:MAG TPA: TonB family protein, partial [Polyangiaceae bacterium]
MKANIIRSAVIVVLLGMSVTAEVSAQVNELSPGTNTDASTSEAVHQDVSSTPGPRLTRAPKLKAFVAAILPPDTVATARSKSVVLDLAIDAEGSVREVVVKESAGELLDTAATAAAEQFQFEPAEIDGKPAAVRIGYRYEFDSVLPPLPQLSYFAGVVRNRKTKTPLANVSVRIDEQHEITTDEAGRFHFDAIEPGNYSVFLRAPGLSPIGTEETIAPNTKYEAAYDIEIPEVAAKAEELVDFELVVFAPRLDKKVAATEVAAEQGAKVAGTGGDAVKVVENLPGVARTAVGSGALVVWGASAQDTRVYVDGVRIPVLYHEGGFRSVLHSDLVRSVELQPGGYGSSYGRGLGGLITVGLRPLQSDGYHGSLAADLIDASASVRGNVSERWRFAAAGRKSHLDWMLRQVTDEDPGQYVPIPRYWDGQLRLAYVPNETASVELGALASNDSIDRVQVSADPADNRVERRTTRFSRYYARYRKDLGAASHVLVTPWFGFDRTDISNEVGGIPATQAIATT